MKLFDDLLGKKEKEVEATKDEIIEALEYNLGEKEKIINDLLKELVETERQLEEVLSYQDNKRLSYG